MQDNDPKISPGVITQSLLNALGLNSNQNLSISTSENLKELQSDLSKVIAKRKQLQDNIAAIEGSLVNLESTLSKKQSGIMRWFTKVDTIENLNNEINDSKNSLNSLQQELSNCTLNFDGLEVPKYEDIYQKVVSAFDVVCTSNKIWDIVSRKLNTEIKSSASSTVDRMEVKFFKKDFDFIKSKYPALCFPNADGLNIYLFPTFMMLKGSADTFELIDLKEINFVFKEQRFIEPQISKPADTNIIDFTWAKVNKDGKPDMRFKGNYQTPIVKYASFSFSSSKGVNELYYISNYEASEQFANVFNEFLSASKEQLNQVSFISYEYFNIVRRFSDDLIVFSEKLKANKSFCDFLDKVQGIQKLTKEGAKKAIGLLLIFDIVKCFNLISDLYNYKSKEAFAIIYLQSRLYGLNFDYQNIYMLYNQNLLSNYKTIYDSMKGELSSNIEDENFFKLSYMLNAFDKDLKQEYLSNLYQFASIVIKADGVVTTKEEEVLKHIMKASNEKIKEEEQHVKVNATNEKQSLEQVLADLNTLTGLNNVKEEIRSLINFIRIQKARESSGLKSSNISYHIVFTGNPGTGKTTVARIVSKVYKCLGILSEGQLVETDRSGLVAEYVGQTAVKVNKTVDSALNGVLFIDEAYSIVGENKDDFGKEAVATLIKRMEDDRDKLVLILAGYTNEMKIFIDTNPGLKSRFNRYIEFPDYSPDELLSIFETQCAKLDYKLTENAKVKAAKIFDRAFSTRNKSFGNGRFVRNVFEKTLENQANRLASVTSLDKVTLTTIESEDIS